jgi:SPP1 family phage portal protein
LQSDRVNDKEQLVEALLILQGIGVLNDEHFKLIKQKRVLSIPENSDAKYLIKTLNETQIQILKKDLEEDIHKFSMTPNLADVNFVGNSSGVALQYKLISFEANLINKQRNMEIGLRQRFEMFKNYLMKLKKIKTDINLYDISLIFKRNLPKNNLEISQMINNLLGSVSKETLISELSFVEDAKKELEWAKMERDEENRETTSNFGNLEPDTEIENE